MMRVAVVLNVDKIRAKKATKIAVGFTDMHANKVMVKHKHIVSQ